MRHRHRANHRRWGRSLLFVILLLLVWILGQGSAIAFPRSLLIEQARQQPDGAEVVVAGQISVPSGAFGSASLDQGFALQDPTGGIYVSTPEDLHLSLGETVEITGTVQDDGHGQRMVQLKRWRSRPSAMPGLRVRDASAMQAGKHLDGMLVTVQGQVVRPLQDDAPYGDRLWVEDETGKIQIYIPKSTQIAPRQLPCLKVGQTVRVTGFSSQYDDHDEVMPRSRDDIMAIN